MATITGININPGATTGHYLTIAETVENGDTVTLDYDKTIGNVVDLADNPLDDITDAAVTNNVAAWTTFDGSTTHIYFGDILNDVFFGADKKWAYEITVRNWTKAAGVNIPLFSQWVNSPENSTNLAGPYLIILASDNATAPSRARLVWTARTGAGGGIYGVYGNQELPTTETKIRVEYDGSIDTAIEDRVKFYIDDVEKTAVDLGLTPDNFPEDIGTDAQAIELAFGKNRKPTEVFKRRCFRW